MVMFMLYERTPFALNIIAGPVISYITILINIVIFVVLFDKRIKTPSTVIMQALAVADSLTALCTYGFEPIFSGIYIIYTNHSADTYYASNSSYACHDYEFPVVTLEYPYCILHYCITQLADNFHLASVFLTTSLGLHKFIVVAFPIWSRRRFTLRMSVIISSICNLLSLSIHLPKMFVVTVSSKKHFTGRDICIMSEPHEGLQKFVLTYYPILFAVFLISAVVVMILSTTFITFTLIRRKHVRGHSSASEYEMKSSALIMCVLVVFLWSEIPSLYVNIKLINTFYKKEESTDDSVISVMRGIVKWALRKCFYHNHQEYCAYMCSYIILANSPYSEKINYLLSLNLVGMNINSLKHTKLLMEIVKISTIMACASNFIIYVIMSKKLRNTLSKKCKFWNRAGQVEGFEMR